MKKGPSAVMIQARMGSSRVPGKVMTELYRSPISGERWPLLKILINRMKRARVDLVVVNTTKKPEDDVIERLCVEMEVPCHRGADEDVLGRHIESAERFGIDICALIGADTPLICPLIVGQSVAIHRSHDKDMTWVRDGFCFWLTIYHRDVLKFIHERADAKGKEHMAYYAQNHPEEVSVYNLHALGHYRHWDFHMGLDMPYQIEFYRKILSDLGSDPDWVDVLRYLEERPTLVESARLKGSDNPYSLDPWQVTTFINPITAGDLETEHRAQHSLGEVDDEAAAGEND